MTPRVVADLLALIGLVCLTAGVFLTWGLGYALICAGVYISAMAANMARLLNAIDNPAETRRDTQRR